MNFANRTIWTADNMEILPGIDSECVDLIYLDPPFNSNRDYAAPIGSKAAGAAFKDTWTLSDLDVAAMGRLADTHPGVYAVIEAAGKVHGKGMMSYLVMMADRLVELHRILKPSGSLYLHCDPTANSYLRLVLDGVFGLGNFMNEIVWKRRQGASSAVHKSRRYGVVTDTILFYTKSSEASFETQYTMDDPQYQDYIKRTFKYIDDNGRRYGTDNLANPALRPNLIYEYKGYPPPQKGWAISKAKMEQWDAEGRLHFPSNPTGRIRRKRFLDELKGKPVQNLWADIRMISSHSKERTGYPTQKPLALMERIIVASSNEGDVVLDPFCGCATTCIAAEKLGRRWAGIDISPNAVNQIRYRMAQTNLDIGGRTLSVHTSAPVRSDGTKMPRRQIKHTLYGQQEGDCNGCGEHFAFHMLEIDHVWPRSKGGPDTLENSQLLCRHCNSLKATGTMDDLAVKLTAWQRGGR